MSRSKVGNSNQRFPEEAGPVPGSSGAFAWLCACSNSGERVNRVELNPPHAYSHYRRAPGYPG